MIRVKEARNKNQEKAVRYDIRDTMGYIQITWKAVVSDRGGGMALSGIGDLSDDTARTLLPTHKLQ